jgi:hypothetical protein
MKKRTPEEILRALDEPLSPEEDMERLLSMSAEEVNAELAAAGYTPEELAAEDERILGPARPAPVVEPPRPSPEPRGERREPAKVLPFRQRAPGLWARVAAAAAVLGPVGYLALSEVGESITLVASGADAGAERLEAAALRSEAADALETGQWAHCLALLDEAKRMDPKGDDAPGVRDARRIAMGKLGMGDASRP